MRHYRDQVIMKERKIASALVKEIIREVDAQEEEDEHIKQNFNKRYELVDKDARLSIRKHKNDSFSDEVLSWMK